MFASNLFLFESQHSAQPFLLKDMSMSLHTWFHPITFQVRCGGNVSFQSTRKSKIFYSLHEEEISHVRRQSKNMKILA